MPAGIWTAKLDMPLPLREGHRAANIGIQKLFNMYGSDPDTGGITDNDEYDNVGDFWTVKTNGPSPARDTHDATAIGADKAYCFCGNSSGALRDNDEYSMSGNNWTSKVSAAYGKRGTGASTIGTDKGYSYGGWSNYKKMEEYSQSGNSWTTKPDMGGSNRERGAAFTVQGEAYWVGGGGSTEVESYEPTGEVWTTRASAGAVGLSWVAGTVISGKGYVTSSSGSPYEQTLEHDPTVDSWVTQTVMPNRRYNHSAADGGLSEFYVFGGRTTPGSPGGHIQSNDEFHMPSPPWVENLTPAHEETDVAEDANITFDVMDNNGVDTATLNVTINGIPVITGGVFQAGYNGTIVEIT